MRNPRIFRRDDRRPGGWIAGLAGSPRVILGRGSIVDHSAKPVYRELVAAIHRQPPSTTAS